MSTNADSSHWAEHVRMGSEYTSFCERKPISSAHFGLEDQVRDVWGILPEDARRTIANGFSEWASVNDSGELIGVIDECDWDYLADAIEDATSALDAPIWWEDGEPFSHPRCYLLDMMHEHF